MLGKLLDISLESKFWKSCLTPFPTRSIYTRAIGAKVIAFTQIAITKSWSLSVIRHNWIIEGKVRTLKLNIVDKKVTMHTDEKEFDYI